MIDLLYALAGLPVGALVAIPAYRAGRRQRIEGINYKQRWENALELLAGEGRLTEEEVAAITESPEPEEAENPYADMYSEDRAEVAVARAKNGLPPDDDLADMYSEDRAEVLAARAKYARRQPSEPAREIES
jgi:hypothetical protein